MIWNNKPVKNPSANNFYMRDGAQLNSSPQQLVCSMQTINVIYTGTLSGVPVAAFCTQDLLQSLEQVQNKSGGKA